MADRDLRIRPALAVALAAILLLSSCGEDGTAGRSGGGDRTDGKRLTPLAEFLGWDGAPSTAEEDRIRRQERLVQELVARCMRGQGFDYVPEEPSGRSAGGGPFALPPAEFAREYGYGITTIDASDVGGPETDPNQVIVDALSPEAEAAYRRALYGEAGARPLPGWIEPLPGAAPKAAPQDTPEDAGCYQEAQDEVYGPAGAEQDEGLAAAFAELNQELTALQNRIDREPRVEDARSRWADCMAGAGFAQYGGPSEPPETIRERFRELTGLSEAPVDPRAPGVRESEELVALRDHERAVAQADLGCRNDYDETLAEVRFELEEEFVAGHRELLQRYRELAGVSGGEG